VKILILGCGGFIGSHLIERLLRSKRYEITGVDVSEYKIRSHLEHFDFRQRDVFEDPDLLEEEIAGSDTVVFLASICNPAMYVSDPAETIRSNFTRPSRIVEFCTKHRKWLISISTCEVYGRTLSSYVGDSYADESLYLQEEESTPSVLGPIHATRWSYASAKQLLDRYIHALSAEGLKYTIVRPYNFFGARMDYIPDTWNSGVPRVLACFMDALFNDKPIRLVDGGHAYRTITYIDDAIDALERILERPETACCQLFNIANPDNELTIEQLARKMRAIYAELTGDPKYLNHPIEVINHEEFYGSGYEDCDRRVPDISKAKDLLGWQPVVGLDKTLEYAVRFFVDFEKSRTDDSTQQGAPTAKSA
jgi:UDP-apiose/xylose synthase